MAKNTKNNDSKSTDGTLSDKKETFLKIFEKNRCNVAVSCRKSNIGRRTYYNWKEADKDFAQACVDTEEGLIDNAEDKLQELINKNNPIAVLFYLKTKGKKRGYIEKQEVELIKPIDEIEFDGL